MILNDTETAEQPELVETILDELRDAGLKATAQRRAIVSELVGDLTHPTAPELFARMQARVSGISFATVYNTLDALHSIGRVRRLEVGGPTRFDPNGAPHDHAICDGCGAVHDIPPRSRRRPRLEGFEVRRVETIFRGLCAACRH